MAVRTIYAAIQAIRQRAQEEAQRQQQGGAGGQRPPGGGGAGAGAPMMRPPGGARPQQPQLDPSTLPEPPRLQLQPPR
jgi:hypothetical protein